MIGKLLAWWWFECDFHALLQHDRREMVVCLRGQPQSEVLVNLSEREFLEINYESKEFSTRSKAKFLVDLKDLKFGIILG